MFLSGRMTSLNILIITYICSHFTNIVLGTPFVSLLFRCFGAKIGKRVFIDTGDFTEFDLITIEDEVCINSEAVIQTHLYEDRIFKMSTINIRKDAMLVSLQSFYTIRSWKKIQPSEIFPC